jgi:hypothetical protein
VGVCASALDLLLLLGGHLCVGTSAAADRRPAINIGKLTACPPEEEVAASAVVSRASWTTFKCLRVEIINFTTRAQGKFDSYDVLRHKFRKSRWLLSAKEDFW